MVGFDTIPMRRGRKCLVENLVPADCQHNWQVKFVGDDIISRLLGHLDYRSDREETLEMSSGEKLMLWTRSCDGCEQFAGTVGQSAVAAQPRNI